MSLFKKIAEQITMSGEKKKITSLKEELQATLQQNMEQVRAEHEDAAACLEKFGAIIVEKLEAHLPQQIAREEAEGEPEEIDTKNAVPLFYISEDKMKAFACILPPVNEGANVQQEAFEKELRYTGISYGIDNARIKKAIAEEDYLMPFLVAKGTPAENGADGQKTAYFEPKARIKIQAAEGDIVDFKEDLSMQIVKKDAMICCITTAEKAKDGSDVVGKVLKGVDGVDLEITPGSNTYLSPDGKQLLASEDGAISITEDGHFCVKPQRTISGDVGRHTGNVYAKGDLYISGNVTGDIVVKADGNLIIDGEVRAGEIRAGGNLRIQKGAVKASGNEDLKLFSGGQLQCAVMEGVTAEAEGSIYAEVIMDSDITTKGSVYINSDRGLLIGGSVKAYLNVMAKEIGNLSECENFIWAGYDPEARIRVEEKKAQLQENKATLEMLQKNVANLKALGSRLPEDKKDLLEKLVEQRDLYEQNEDELATELKHLTAALRKSGNGTVSCDTLYPTTEIKIGEKQTVIKRQMSPCRVFVQAGSIVAR